ncbi:MAG: mechanosensitive ion channel family protein [Candidatus Sericytochromatia bacterium]
MKTYKDYLLLIFLFITFFDISSIAEEKKISSEKPKINKEITKESKQVVTTTVLNSSKNKIENVIQNTISSDSDEKKGYPVTFESEVLFYIYTGTEIFTPQDRANIIMSRLKSIAENSNINIESINLLKENNNINIYADKHIIMTVTEEDAKVSGLSRQELGHNYKEKIQEGLKKLRKEFTLQSLLLGIIITFILTLSLFILIKLINYFFPKIYNKIEKADKNNLIPSFKIQKFEIINSEDITTFIYQAFNFFRIALILFLLYVYIPLVLNFFPWTKGVSDKLFGYITNPIKNIITSVINFIPNIFNIIVIAIFAYYLTKFVRVIFRAIENNKISIPGFHEDWNETTYKMVRFLIFAFSSIMIFPYLPGSSSPAFQGVSVFIGLLISFGSGSAISNMVAGIVLTYTNSFKIGDRVKIGETTGDVIEKNLLVTRVRTIKNVDITIPNSSVLSSHIINYTSVSKEKGLILHTTITIGYDIPWKKVHQALIDSALKTDDILDIPKPFVFQTSLDDFYVSYQLNAYTNNSHSMSRIYSDLHQNIQDIFNEVGIEIMSPHYSAIRDGNLTTIPSNYLDKDYKIPTFRIQDIKGE